MSYKMGEAKPHKIDMPLTFRNQVAKQSVFSILTSEFYYCQRKTHGVCGETEAGEEI